MPMLMLLPLPMYMKLQAVEGGTAQQQLGGPPRPRLLATAFWQHSLALFGRTLTFTLLAHALAKANANVVDAAIANVHEPAGR